MKGNRIKTVVIGAGHMGRLHAIKLASLPDVELSAVVDSDLDRAKRVAAEAKCSALKSIDELGKDVRAAIISVPTALHFDISSLLLDRGVDLFVEKPISETVGEAKRLVEKADRLGRILAVGHIERLNPAFRAAAGGHGKPFMINARRFTPFKERARNIDVVRDLMIHDIDLAASIVGADMELVNAWGIKVLTDKIDVATAVFKSGDLRVMFEAGRAHAAEVREIEIFDAKGRLLIDLYKREASRFDAGESSMIQTKIEVSPSDALEEELRRFIDACRERTRPAVTGAEGAAALDMSLNVLSKIEKGRA